MLGISVKRNFACKASRISVGPSHKNSAIVMILEVVAWLWATIHSLFRSKSFTNLFVHFRPVSGEKKYFPTHLILIFNWISEILSFLSDQVGTKRIGSQSMLILSLVDSNKWFSRAGPGSSQSFDLIAKNGSQACLHVKSRKRVLSWSDFNLGQNQLSTKSRLPQCQSKLIKYL